MTHKSCVGKGRRVRVRARAPLTRPSARALARRAYLEWELAVLLRAAPPVQLYWFRRYRRLLHLSCARAVAEVQHGLH